MKDYSLNLDRKKKMMKVEFVSDLTTLRWHLQRHQENSRNLGDPDLGELPWSNGISLCWLEHLWASLNRHGFAMICLDKRTSAWVHLLVHVHCSLLLEQLWPSMSCECYYTDNLWAESSFTSSWIRAMLGIQSHYTLSLFGATVEPPNGYLES